MCLINADLAVVTHVEPSLLGVHIRSAHKTNNNYHTQNKQQLSHTKQTTIVKHVSCIMIKHVSCKLSIWLMLRSKHEMQQPVAAITKV